MIFMFVAGELLSLERAGKGIIFIDLEKHNVLLRLKTDNSENGEQ